MSDLRTRIAAALEGEQYVNLLGNGYDYDDLLALADAVIRELDYEERVTSAIQGYAQSEMSALSYHDPLCRETAYGAMRRLDMEARQIARYSMTYRKEADDE